jgi:hypothetical protein
VRQQLVPKLKVAGSNPVSRSIVTGDHATFQVAGPTSVAQDEGPSLPRPVDPRAGSTASEPSKNPNRPQLQSIRSRRSIRARRNQGLRIKGVQWRTPLRAVPEAVDGQALSSCSRRDRTYQMHIRRHHLEHQQHIESGAYVLSRRTPKQRSAPLALPALCKIPDISHCRGL